MDDGENFADARRGPMPERAPRANAVARGVATGAGHLVRVVGSFLIPPVCLACRTPLQDHNMLCAACWGGIRFIRPPVCDRLGIPLPFDTGGPSLSAAAIAYPPVYDRARAVADYDQAMRELIHQLKYADRHDANTLFGQWLGLAAHDLVGGADLIVPVPLSRMRLLARRFNQAAILASALSRRSGIPWEPLVLKRVRRTRSQVGLTRDQRRRNVAGAFRLEPGQKHLVADRNILLVDDVITTGATVEACARTLKQAGAARVDVVALARLIDADAVTV